MPAGVSALPGTAVGGLRRGCSVSQMIFCFSHPERRGRREIGPCMAFCYWQNNHQGAQVCTSAAVEAPQQSDIGCAAPCGLHRGCWGGSKIIWVDVFFPLTQIMHSLKCTIVTTCSVPKDNSRSKCSTSHSFMASATELKVTLGVLLNGQSERWLSLFMGNVWYNPNVPGRINNGWHKG